MRDLTEDDIDALEVGAAILGTGGGGNPYIGKLRCKRQLRSGQAMTLMGLDELPDDAFVIEVGGIGAPVVSIEKIDQGQECLRALRALEEYYGRKADALIAAEIGGSNALEPLITASQAGIPVVDGDGMGRAFPEMQMGTFSIYGKSSAPAALADEKGNIVLYREVTSEIWFERLARATVTAMGATAGSATSPMPGHYVKKVAVPHTVTKALDLGNAVLSANRSHTNPIEVICRTQGGVRLMDGKITDVRRHLRGGFNIGEVRIQGVDAHAGETAVIALQNEFLAFTRGGVTEVCVPDLIVLLDLDTGHAITTDVLRFGQRVAVVALPCHDLLRTPEALAVVGPQAFGLQGVTFRPLPAHPVP